VPATHHRSTRMSAPATHMATYVASHVASHVAVPSQSKRGHQRYCQSDQKPTHATLLNQTQRSRTTSAGVTTRCMEPKLCMLQPKMSQTMSQYSIYE
jgi:hypothetical protein